MNIEVVYWKSLGFTGTSLGKRNNRNLKRN